MLPIPTPPFAGVIEPNLVNSTPGWPPTIMPPAGAPNVLLILIDDAGFGSNSVFGGVVPNADPGKPSPARPALHPDAQYSAVFANRGGAPDRAQSPLRRLWHGRPTS